MFNNVSTADKIETIVDCFMKDRSCTQGFFGSVRVTELGWEVSTDERTFYVYTDASGHWNVREGDAVGVDAMLVYAASNLIGADLVRKQGRI